MNNEQSRIEEIREAVREEMASNDIEDIPENYLLMLQGLRDGWAEDEDDCIEKTLYTLALITEIFCVEMKLKLGRITN